jgi:CRP/FNR family cyclic AMP-dependent transcriptional regulator
MACTARGDYFGEMSLDGGPRSASVMAKTACACAVLTRQTLREHIKAQPEFAFELIARVIGRARMATQSARSMALLDVYRRLTQLLQAMAMPQPDGAHIISSRMTHAQLASRIGCSREMVSRVLSDLTQGGYLTSEGRGLLLAKPLPIGW